MREELKAANRWRCKRTSEFKTGKREFGVIINGRLFHHDGHTYQKRDSGHAMVWLAGKELVPFQADQVVDLVLYNDQE